MKSWRGSWWMFFWNGNSTSTPANRIRLCLTTVRTSSPGIRARSFYRVGWYDNILAGDRMSLYVELGADRHATFDVEAARQRVLADLAAEGIIDGHRLLSWHSVVLDPAYVHITQRSTAEHARVRRTLEAAGVHSVGRYGGWTYCSIEDNLVETRALARALGPLL